MEKNNKINIMDKPPANAAKIEKSGCKAPESTPEIPLALSISTATPNEEPEEMPSMEGPAKGF